MAVKKLTPKKYKELYSQVPKTCVEVVVVGKDGVLLTRRNIDAWNGMWHIPGGTMRYGEELFETVQRVAKDELGISVLIKGLAGVLCYGKEEEKERGFGWSVGIAFLCTTGDEVVLGEGADAFGYFKEAPDNMIRQQQEFLQNLTLLQ